MKVYLASDHGGFHLKEKVMAHLSKAGYEVEDVGDKTLDPADDYPQFAYAAATKVLGSTDDDPRSIIVVVQDVEEAKMSRNDNDANVLCLPARILEDDEALTFDIIDTWLKTPFSKAERHARRVREIEELYG
jgi:ribose 5-phosphate isomerase B